MAELIDQYRPTTFSEVVGQGKALAQLDDWRKRGGIHGRKLLITGKSGTGKTSLARLIAAECADTNCNVELDEPRSITAEDLTEEFRKLRCRPLFGKGRSLIINEIHLLRKSAITAFLTLTEKGPAGLFPQHAVLICTTSASHSKLLRTQATQTPPRSFRGSDRSCRYHNEVLPIHSPPIVRESPDWKGSATTLPTTTC